MSKDKNEAKETKDEPMVYFDPSKYTILTDTSANLVLTGDGIAVKFSNPFGYGVSSSTVSWKVIDEYRKKLEEMEPK